MIVLMLMDWQQEPLEKGTQQFPGIVQAVEAAGGSVLFISKGREHAGEYKALIVPGEGDVFFVSRLANETSRGLGSYWPHNFILKKIRLVKTTTSAVSKI